MKESLLHLVWEQELFKTSGLKTVNQQDLKILNKGVLNNLQGPDFSNAVLGIGDQKWAGTIEIHVKSSDWYAHEHQNDENYQNVILHVVYEYDVDVFDVHSNVIPTLELKKYIDHNVLIKYENLMKNTKQWIFCESDLKYVDNFKLNAWLERLYIERLERKTNEVAVVFENSGQDWEGALFLLMAKYFGGNINGSIFLKAFSQVNFSVVRKQIMNQTTTSFLFGLVGLLEKDDIEDPYYISLKKEFKYQEQKYGLEKIQLPKLNFYGCRPHNFPTIRLIQLISFYEKNRTVFTNILKVKDSLESLTKLYDIPIDDYWKMHYNFGKPSKKSSKKITKAFVNLLLINVIIPVLFYYHRSKGNDVGYLLDLMYEIDSEKNNITSKFNQLGVKIGSALESQSLLTLKKEYCDKQRCAECAIGIDLIRNNK